MAECVASTWLADKSKMTLALASDLEHPDPSGGLLGGWLSQCSHTQSLSPALLMIF